MKKWIISIIVVLIILSVILFVDFEDRPMASVTVTELSFIDDITAVIKGEFYLERMSIDFNLNFDVYVYATDGMEIGDYEVTTIENMPNFKMTFDERFGTFELIGDHKAQISGFEYHITPQIWWFDDDGTLHEVYGDKFIYISP